ncbi:MAG TPA: hypothetical protein VHU81_21480 [Thermoanaerobaculia bacterium]|nr:hypothetical protein [Thermoanaerobaculia bacterium]
MTPAMTPAVRVARLSAIECFQRGVVSTAANWELAAVLFLQSLVVTVLAVAGLIIPLVALGVSLDPRAWESAILGASDLPLDRVEEVLDWLAEAWPMLVLGLIGTLAVWTVAFVAYSYFQAGVYGILYEADRRAPMGGAASRQQLRAFTLVSFQAWAGRRTWPFFWLTNLFGIYSLVPILIYVALGAAVARTATTPAAVLGLGCIGLFLVALPLCLVLLWFMTSQASLAEAKVSSVRQAARLGWDVLMRRLGAVLLLVVIFIALSLVFSLVFIPLGLAVDLTAGDDLWVRGGAQFFLTLLQTLPNALLAVALAGALVALVRSETRISEGIAA